jgi:hypothetical protein
MRSPVPTHGFSRGARWFRTLLAALGVATTVAAQNESTPAASDETSRRELVRATFRYSPAVRDRAENEVVAEPGVLQMPKVTVTDSRLQTLLERFLEARRRAAEQNRPGWVNGASFRAGSLRGRPTDIGVMSWNELLGDEAKFRPDGPDVARWEMFRVQF